MPHNVVSSVDASARLVERRTLRRVLSFLPVGQGAWCELVCGHWRFLATAPRSEPARVRCQICAAQLKQLQRGPRSRR